MLAGSLLEVEQMFGLVQVCHGKPGSLTLRNRASVRHAVFTGVAPDLGDVAVFHITLEERGVE